MDRSLSSAFRSILPAAGPANRGGLVLQMGRDITHISVLEKILRFFVHACFEQLTHGSNLSFILSPHGLSSPQALHRSSTPILMVARRRCRDRGARNSIDIRTRPASSRARRNAFKPRGLFIRSQDTVGPRLAPAFTIFPSSRPFVLGQGPHATPLCQRSPRDVSPERSRERSVDQLCA